MSQERKEMVKVASLSLTLFEKDKENSIDDELKEALKNVTKQKQEYEQKAKAEHEKAQRYSAAAAKAKKPLQAIPKQLDLHAFQKCEKKLRSLQRKIAKLKADEYELEIQLGLRSEAEMKPVYDGESPADNSSIEKDMKMTDDELRKTIDGSNKDIKDMQLKPLAKFGRTCQHMLEKPFISMKSNISKLTCKKPEPINYLANKSNGCI